MGRGGRTAQILMRWLLTILLLLPLKLLGDVGTIRYVTIETNGWVAEVSVEGIGTNAMFYNFFIATTNATATATNVIYTLSSTNGLKIDFMTPGWNSDGTTNIIPYTVYGVEVLRLPSPSQTTNDIFLDATGTNSVFRVALSDFIGDLDSSILATVNVGAFATTNSVTNSVGITGLSVTNGSLLGYPISIANWTWPGWNQETGSVMIVRAVGFNHYARNGQPLACMEFVTTDEGGIITTNRVSQMEIDWLMPDIIHFGEYIGRIPLSPFTHSNNLQTALVAKPWRGDIRAVFDTRDNRYSMPTPYPASITNFYFTNTYSTRAVVALTGDDTLGRSTNVASHELVDPAHYYSTVNAALAGIRTNNLGLFGHQTCGGAMVDVRTGITNSMGGTASMAGIPRVWATIREYPGDAVVLTNHTGAQDISDRVKLEDIELGYNGTLIAWVNCEALWLKNCRFNAPGSAPINTGVTCVYVTGGTAPLWTQGFKAFTSNPNTFALLRGLDMDGMNAASYIQTMVGCRKTTYSGALFALSHDTQARGNVVADWQIFYNCSFKGMSNLVSVSIGDTWGTTNGAVFANLELENLRTNSSITLYTITNKPASNVVWMNVTLEGCRQQYFYNDIGSLPVWRVFCQAQNSIFVTVGEASDTGTPPADGGRIGDWSVRYRVGASGNVIQMVNYEASHSDIENQGLNNFRPPTPLRTDAGWIKYVNRAGAGSGGTGPGNYRLQSSSPLFSPLLSAGWVLPFDLDGRYRSAIDPPGAFVAGNVKKGAFF